MYVSLASPFAAGLTGSVTGCDITLYVTTFSFQLQWSTKWYLRFQRRGPVMHHGRNPFNFPSIILDRLLVVNGRRINPFLEWLMESEESTDPLTDGVRIWGPPFIGSTVLTRGDAIFGERHFDLKKDTMNTRRSVAVAPQAHPIPIPSISWSEENKNVPNIYIKLNQYWIVFCNSKFHFARRRWQNKEPHFTF